MRRSEGKRVLVVGDVNVDLIVPFPRFSASGEIKYPDPQMQGGGTCGNTAAALQKLGIQTDFMGTVGDDAHGRYLLQEMQEAGIETEAVIVDNKLNTICVFAFVDERGERYLWGWPREKQSFKELNPNGLKWEHVENAGWVHSSGMVFTYDTSARHSVTAIFKKAFELGIPTSFDLNLRVENDELDPDYRQAVLNILPYCSYILGSGKEEFYYLNPQKDWRDSARSFATEANTVIARMGKGGSMVITPHELIEEKAFDVQVIDTVGAGDVFNAGFIAARLTGHDLKNSIIWGNAVSGYKVGRKGARSTPNKAELEEFLKQFGL